MKRAGVLLLLILLAMPGWGDEPAPADLVLRHGAIYTMDASRSWAESVAIRGGRIVYVGPDQGVKPYVQASTREVDLQGRMVLPAFEDSHVHPVWGGSDLMHCRLDGLKTADAVYQAVRKYGAAHPHDPWVVGAGWDLPLFPHGSPTRTALDRLVPDRPCYMEAADGHSAWVNSLALKRSGVTVRTPDPPNGRIERDRNGSPSGTLREAALDLVKQHVPKPSAEENVTGLRMALKLANRCGITSLYEACADDAVLQAYHTLDQDGQLTARVSAALQTDDQKGPEQVDGLVDLRNRYQSPHLRPTSAKIFADGVIEAHTAVLVSPYRDRPGDRGRLNLAPEAFNRLVVRLDHEGFQVHVHAIGDGAVHAALDAFAAARKANGRRDSRHVIAHLELVDPKDMVRFRELGVVADVQPLWAFRDDYVRDLTEPFLEPERSGRLYPMGSLWRSGAPMAAGSDWDVTSINPLEAIQVAITRRGPDEPPGPAWLANETLDLPTVLALYTIGSAYAQHQEQDTGSVEVGKAADLIVLDHNLFAIPPQAIHRTQVLWTLLEGREVYRSSMWTP